MNSSMPSNGKAEPAAFSGEKSGQDKSGLRQSMSASLSALGTNKSKMSKSARNDLFSTVDSPGPGNYDIVSKPEGPMYSIKGKKEQKASENPGPGTYDPKIVTSKSPKNPFIGKAERKELIQVIDSPGPGTYDKVLKPESPRWTFHGIKENGKAPDNPGPGAYDPKILESKTAKSSFIGKAERKELSQIVESPGPGAYEKAMKPETPSWTFHGPKENGKLERHSLDVPGPGSYDPKPASSKTPKNEFIGKAGRKELSQIIDSPGPGTYEKSVKPATPSWTFHGPKQNTSSSQSFDSPGPGSYDPKLVSPKTPKTAFIGKAERQELSQVIESPGPGAYEKVTKAETPSWSFQGSVASLSKNPVSAHENPGPGAYDPKIIPSKSPKSAFIGKSERKELSQIIDSPGPGTYEKVVKPQTPSWTFHGPKELAKSLEIPGPGAYDPKLVASKAPKSAFIGKADRKELSQIIDSPGPGTYDKVTKPQSPSWTFHGPKDIPASQSFVGPGKYDPDLPKTSVNTVTPKANRPKLFDTSDNPGPGQYTYSDPKSPIKFSFGSSHRPGIHSDTPGPGSYEYPKHFNGSNSISGTSQSGFKFGSEPKKTLQFSSDTPSAIYDPKLQNRSPAFSFGEKFKNKFDNGVPGPGSYGSEKSLRVETSKMSKSQRFPMTPQEKEALSKPGPGMYEVNKEKGKSKPNVAKAKREFHKSTDTPGPGQYNIL